MNKLTFHKKAPERLAVRTALRAGANPTICAELGTRCTDACKRIDEHMVELRQACMQTCVNGYEACIRQP